MNNQRARLDLGEFNSSLIEMLSLIKDKGSKIFKNITDISDSITANSVNNANESDDGKVDLDKLKLNIQALKEAVKVAKNTKKRKIK